MLTWHSPAQDAVLIIGKPQLLVATASSGLPVNFRVESGPAIISDGAITATNTGRIKVAAEQMGNSTSDPVRLIRTLNQPTSPTERVCRFTTVYSARAWQLVDHLAYVAGGNLQVLDISNPAAPERLGGVGYRDLDFKDVQVEGNLAYLACGLEGLKIMDVSNPSWITPVGRLSTRDASDVEVVGNLAFVADGIAGLQILNVGDPTLPYRVGGFDTSDEARAVQVLGNRAYIADGQEGLQIINVSDPAAPKWEGGIDTPGNAQGVKVVGNRAYVADGSQGLQIFDVTDPASPKRLGGFDGNPVFSVDVVGDLAYVANGFFGFGILDVSDPSAPVRLGGYASGIPCDSLKVAGDLVFLSYDVSNNKYLEIVRLLPMGIPQKLTLNIPTVLTVNQSPVTLTGSSSADLPVGFKVVSGPASIAGNGLTLTGPGIVIIRGEQAGNAQFLPAKEERVMTVSERRIEQQIEWASPAVASVLLIGRGYPMTATAGSGLPVSFRVLSGPAVIVDGMITATGTGSITLVAEQIGNATYSPIVVIRTFNQPAAFVGKVGALALGKGAEALVVQVLGPIAYIAHGAAGLQILDVSDPASPRRLGGTTNGSAYDVKVLNKVAYVAGGDLQIFDVSNPLRPEIISTFATIGSARGVHVVGNLAYVADADSNDPGLGGLIIVDISNPNSPFQVGKFKTRYANRVQVVGHLAYVADYWWGLKILDVSNPAAPQLLSSFDTTDGLNGGPYDPSSLVAVDLQVVGNLAYLAGGYPGLLILDVSEPSKPRTVGGFKTSGQSLGVDVLGSLAYLAVKDAGLQAVDVSNPAVPRLVSEFKTPGSAHDIQVIGTRAYVADGSSGLQIVGLSIPQTVSFSPPKTLMMTNSPFSLSATSSLGQPVGFRFISGPAQLVGEQLTLQAAGTVVIRAEQLGNGQIQATSVEQSIVVSQVPQGLEWNSPPMGSVLLLGKPYQLKAVADSGLPVSFRVECGPAVIRDGIVTVTNVGSVMLTAEQFGNAVYASSFLSRTWNQPNVTMQPVAGFQRPNALGLHVVAGFAYVAGGDKGVHVFDIRNPDAPKWVGGLDTAGWATGVQVAGTRAYVADGVAGLQILDLTKVTAIKRLGGFNTSGETAGVQLIGNLAFVADRSAGLQILNVGNPALPYRVGGFDTAGEARAVQVVGKLAYVADGDAGLQILDVSDSTAPKWVGGFNTSGDAFAVQVVGKLAYVADGPAGVQIIDVSNAAAPKWLASFDVGWSVHGVQIEGSLAYLVDGKAGLQVLDVTNPAAPKRIGGLDIDGSANAIQVVGKLVYVASGDGGLRILDVTNPATPKARGVSNSPYWAYGVHRVGNLAYVAYGSLGLCILDVSEPDSPKHLGGFETSGYAHKVQVEGRLAYVADGSSGLQILDVGNPAAPQRLGGLDTGVSAKGLHVVGDLAYVADYTGLMVLNVSNPAVPRKVGSFDSKGEGRAVQVVGNLAYLADGSAGLQILDIRNPAAPISVGRFDTSGEALAVQVVGNRAYIADGRSGLLILDVSNPAAPWILGSSDTPGVANDVRVECNLAYVADGASGLQILDVSNPSAPKRLAILDTAGEAQAVDVSGESAFVADGGAGLVVVRLLQGGVPQTLLFNPPSRLTLSDSPFSLSATSSSRLQVGFTVVSGPAILVGDQLSLTGAGVVVVRAEQAGDAQVLPSSVTRSISIAGDAKPLIIRGVTASPGGNFRFEVGGSAGARVIIKFSEDLIRWTTVSTNGVPILLDLPMGQSNAAGFYKAVLVP